MSRFYLCARDVWLPMLLVPALLAVGFGCGSDEPATGSSGSAADPAKDDHKGDDANEGAEPPDSQATEPGKSAGTKDAGASGKDAGKVSPGVGSAADAGYAVDAGSAAVANDGAAVAASSPWCDAFAVLEDACGSCHGAEPAAGAPMSLASYDDLVADATISKGKKVYEAVQARIHDAKKPMPPTGQLSADKLAAIDAWIAGGAATAADPTCASIDGTSSASPKPEAKWPPDGCTVYKFVAGDGQKVFVPAGQETHPEFFFDSPWGDNQVQALGFRAITDNPKVLHHWILYAAEGGSFLTGWAPGQDKAQLGNLPSDVAMWMPSGTSSLRLDMHYNNLAGTSDQQDASGTEICVTDQLRKYSSSVFMQFMGIPILPAGTETDTVGTCDVSITEPVFLLSESPHAHKLATHMRFEVVRGSDHIVFRDAPFSFDAQIATPLPAPFELKNGDQVITTCHYVNDTDQLVTFGENTADEMCFNFASYYPMGALSCAGLGGLGSLLGL